MKPVILLVLNLLLIAGCVSCGGGEQPKEIVTVTIQPQKYFAEKIAGDRFDINCIVPNGMNPESYDPSPSHLVHLGKSRAYFKIGYIGFEMAWLDKLMQNNPGMKLYDNSQGIDLLKGTHVCMDEDMHLHLENIDPHIWTSPKGAAVIAENMYRAFVELDPEHKEYFRKNYLELKEQIDHTDSILTAVLSKVPGRMFVIYHPTLSYLARDYNLRQLSIEMDGKEPSPFYLKTVMDAARENHADIIFVQKEFDSKNVRVIADELDGKIVEINPLSYDWVEETIRIANALGDEQTN